jgi:circadian clock protein KaiB
MAQKPVTPPDDMRARFEESLQSGRTQVYVLRLCISGMSPRSQQALANLKRICEEYLEGQYQLEVIDLYQQPELAARHQIVATPTLLKDFPPPVRRLVGNLSDKAVSVRRLDIPEKDDAA